ncbi:hypothetical protein [Blastopirellula marina]|uniref:Uncharacterized protein n=1 Tax=Blastopirellula marina DSM 3645 TaxID=314230 RepID=A3ZM63_9BACT|nr:hypothetical protein [Blastopirellula marina]EAQ82846.1 hypothetical protein DSM3645_10612 [Blastopirellula marina DSM 3645]
MDRHVIDLYQLKQRLGLSCGEETTRQYVAALRQQPTKQSAPAASAPLSPEPLVKQASRHFLHLAIGRLGIGSNLR